MKCTLRSFKIYFSTQSYMHWLNWVGLHNPRWERHQHWTQDGPSNPDESHPETQAEYKFEDYEVKSYAGWIGTAVVCFQEMQCLQQPKERETECTSRIWTGQRSTRPSWPPTFTSFRASTSTKAFPFQITYDLWPYCYLPILIKFQWSFHGNVVIAFTSRWNHNSDDFFGSRRGPSSARWPNRHLLCRSRV